MKSIFCFLLFIPLVGLRGQNKLVLINYKIYTTQLAQLSIQKLGLRSNLNYDPDFDFPLKNLKKSHVYLNIKSNGLYKIADAFNGHIIYLEEGDTIAIQLKEIANIDKLQAKNIYLPFFHNLSAVGKYAWHCTFFDELNKRTSKLHRFDINIHLKNPMLFKNNCDKALLIGQTLIDSLYDKGKVSNNFRSVVLEELNAIYVSWMCATPSRMQKNKINPSYFEKLNTLSFNDSSFAVKCNDYLQAGALYTYYVYNNFNPRYPYSNLSNEVSAIMKNFSGIIRDRLLAWQIQDYIGKDYPAFDSCYAIFLNECKNQIMKDQVIKKVINYVKPVKNINKIDLNTLLRRSKVQIYKDKQESISNIMDDSLIILIDCWATWCSPCREQMPFIHDFEKKYKGKLNVVYLSFDKDEIKWKSFIIKNKLSSNQYLIDNDFASEFSQYFELETIPRYILISKGGLKVLNSRMPLPALTDEFEEELNKYLQ